MATETNTAEFDAVLSDRLLECREGRSRLEILLEVIVHVSGASEAALVKREEGRWTAVAHSCERSERRDRWSRFRTVLAHDATVIEETGCGIPLPGTVTRRQRAYCILNDTDPMHAVILLAEEEGEGLWNDLANVPWRRVQRILARLQQAGLGADAPIFDLANLNDILPGMVIQIDERGETLWWDPKTMQDVIDEVDPNVRTPRDRISVDSQAAAMRTFGELMAKGHVRTITPLNMKGREEERFYVAGLQGEPGTGASAIVCAFRIADVPRIASDDFQFREAFRSARKPGLVGLACSTEWHANDQARLLLGLDGHDDPACHPTVQQIRAAVSEHLDQNRRHAFRVSLTVGESQAHWVAIARFFGSAERPWVAIDLSVPGGETSHQDWTVDDMLQALQQQSDGLPLPALHWDHAGKIIDWNRAAEDLFGYTRREIIGKSMLDTIVPPDQHPFVEGRIHDMVAGASSMYGKNFNVTRDGRRLLCEWHTQSLSASTRTGTVFYSIAVNVTAQYEDEKERIGALARHRETVVREVHHRLKNALQGVANAVRLRDAGDPSAGAMLGEVASMIESVAVVFGLESDATRGKVAIIDMVRAQAERFRETSGCPFETMLDALGRMSLEPQLNVLFSIVMNELLSNAVKHSPSAVASESIRIKADHSPWETTIHVTNTIRGACPEVDMEKESGLGSGLSIVKTLCKHTPIHVRTLVGERNTFHASIVIEHAAMQKSES